MTTNQTIGGVPRDLIEDALAIATTHATANWSAEVRDKLRALLDAPESYTVCESCAKRYVPCPDCKPAAQPQGGPLSELEVLRAAVKELEAMRDARVDAKLAHGVPRAALVTVLSEPRPDAPYCVLEARAVLCALIGAPGFHCSVPAIDTSMLGSKSSAQPQGVPVAEVVATGGPHDSEDRVLVELQAELPPVGTKLYAEKPAPVDDGTTSDKYRAELYDEVWQKARSLGFGNVTEALTFLAREAGEPYAYEYEFATVLYTSGPGKFKKILTSDAPDQHEIDAGSIINVKPLYSLEPRKYDDTLLPFLALMRKELHANAHKGDREGWLKMSTGDALSEIHHHTDKLADAWSARDYPQITEYSADIANCAMMLLDVCNGLPRNN